MGGFNHLWHPCHATHKNQLVDFVQVEFGIFQTGFGGLNGSLKKVVTQLLQFGASQFETDVFRSRRIGRNKGEIDLIFLRTGEGYLRFLGLFLDPLKRIGLATQVHA